ncbi:SCP-like protein [Cooperia oncophora]
MEIITQTDPGIQCMYKSPAKLYEAPHLRPGHAFGVPGNAYESCGDNRGPLMDDNTRYKILYYHEGTRNVLALGRVARFQTGFLPPAKNLFKLRWNCDLEAEARKLTTRLGTVPEVDDPRPIKKRERKYDFISKSIDEWLLPTESYPIDGVKYNVSLYGSSNLYTFANMAYDKIYEVGCNYEECPNGNDIRASLICIYNKKVPDYAPLYEVGDKDPDQAGCNKDDNVCQHLNLPKATCDDLLCKLPNVVSSFL